MSCKDERTDLYNFLFVTFHENINRNENEKKKKQRKQGGKEKKNKRRRKIKEIKKKKEKRKIHYKYIYLFNIFIQYNNNFSSKQGRRKKRDTPVRSINQGFVKTEKMYDLLTRFSE